MKVVISQSMYFPWVGFLEQIRLADIFIHYDDVQFSRGFYNRVQIKTRLGPSWLTVPIENKHQNSLICSLDFSKETSWKSQHINRFSAEYKTAPYFKDALRILEIALNTETTSLSCLNRKSISLLTDYFDIAPSLRYMESTDIAVNSSGSQRILEITKSVGATEYITGHGAKNYLKHEEFEQEGISVLYMNYRRLQYPQLHGPFTPFVSALDLVANCGRNGRQYICSTADDWKTFNKWI